MNEVRVGVLLAGPRLAAWAAWILRAIVDHRDVTLALAIMAPAPASARPTMFALYEWLDRRLFRSEPDASETVDCSAILAGLPREAAVDVILRLGGAPAGGELLKAPAYGVWSPRWGRAGDTAPPLFWELSARAPVVECTVEMQNGNGTAEIARSTSRTDVISLERNRNAAYWKGAELVMRSLDDLASGRRQPAGTAPAPVRTSAAPDDAETARHAVAVAGRVARRKLHEAARQYQWFLGLRPRPADRLPQDDSRPWRPVIPPPDRSYADPFVFRHAEHTYVFFEEFIHRTRLGRLAVGRLGPDGALCDVEPVLPCPHHTSYPYVFRHDGRVFMIPESGDARRVTLFAATRAPIEWEPVATLLEGIDAVDATVHAHGGMLWMWLTVRDETFLYSSDRIDSGWTPHPCNPVVADARTARPAGRPFKIGDRLIRPSQNGAERYGGRVVFNEVCVLTSDAYRERACGSLGPEWAGRANFAAHTYTFDGGWEATDGLRTFARFSGARRRTAMTPG
jgi:hypothetical protein